MSRLSCALLLLLAGCTATTTTNTGATSSSSGGAEPGASSSGSTSPPPAPVCSDTTDFETDAKNCGRCGRACDDGACNAGVCAPRVEATGAAMPMSIAEEIAVVEGRLFARLSHTPNPRTTPSTHPIVRFEGGKLVTVLPDARYGCGGQRVECMASDGKTLFAMTVTGDATTGEASIIKRFDRDGTARKDILVPEEGYGFSQMAAEGGRVVLRGVTGPTALFYEDGKVAQLTPLRNATWPILSGADVLFANIHSIERVSVGSGSVVVGKVPFTTSSGIDSLAANDRFVYAVAATGQQLLPTVHRFPRTGNDADPEKTEVISAEAVERLNAASLKTTNANARTIQERSITYEGRLYFTLLLTTQDQTTSSRMIVEWSEDRGFRAVATIPVRQGESGTRLVVGERRLYWLEQPAVVADDRPTWRILSVPL